MSARSRSRRHRSGLKKHASFSRPSSSKSKSIFFIIVAVSFLAVSFLFLSSLASKRHGHKKPKAVHSQNIAVNRVKRQENPKPKLDFSWIDQKIRAFLQGKKTAVPVLSKTKEQPAERLPEIGQHLQPVPGQGEVSKGLAIAPEPKYIKAKIAIVLDDWGYRNDDLALLEKIEFPITVAILPFLTYSRAVAEFAQNHNDEVIVHMPMEPFDKEQYDLEPNTLLTSMSSSEIVTLLRKSLDAVPYAEGINNHMGSKATTDRRMMNLVMKELHRRQWFFLDSLVISPTVCAPAARAYGVKFAERTIFLDNESDPEYIRGQIMELVAVADKNGMAVGIGHDRPHTLKVLIEMMPQLSEDGYDFVYVSDLVK